MQLLTLPSCFNQTALKWLSLLLVTIGLFFPASAAADDPLTGQDLNNKVYLPVVVKSGQSTPTPPPPPVRVALFMETQWRTHSASIQVDAQGGLHVAYEYYEPNNGQRPTQAVYSYCASQCQEKSNWHGVTMGGDVDEVQLELTPAGQPRILFGHTSTTYTVPSPGRDYFYAACDQNCTDPTQWEVTYILSDSGTDHYFDDDSPQHYFALDPQGRPRFIYKDRNYFYAEPDHLGTYYVYCDANCTQHTPDNPTWFQILITDQVNANYEWLNFPSLTFTSQGGPRAIGYLTPLAGQPDGLYYLGCDTDCYDRANWARIRLLDRGAGTNASWDLELDSSDRPRIAFYKGDGRTAGEHLYYLWCNNNCFNDPDEWYYNDPGLNTLNGKHPDLELDTQNRPRIAYVEYTQGGLGYAWCSANCEAETGAGWQHQVIESRDFLYNVWPVPYPTHCTDGLWDGVIPSLALDNAGNPRIAYDTTYRVQCWYDDPYDNESQPVYKFHLIMRAVRAVFFPQP